MDYFDLEWCKHTKPINPYPPKATTVTRKDGIGLQEGFQRFLVKQNALILRMGENRHPTLNSSPAESFCSTYFKLKGFVDPLSGFTVLIFCID